MVLDIFASILLICFFVIIWMLFQIYIFRSVPSGMKQQIIKYDACGNMIYYKDIEGRSYKLMANTLNGNIIIKCTGSAIDIRCMLDDIEGFAEKTIKDYK